MRQRRARGRMLRAFSPYARARRLAAGTKRNRLPVPHVATEHLSKSYFNVAMTNSRRFTKFAILANLAKRRSQVLALSSFLFKCLHNGFRRALVDRDVVTFLAACEHKGVEFRVVPFSRGIGSPKCSCTPADFPDCYSGRLGTQMGSIKNE